MKKFDFKCRPKRAWLNVNHQCNFRCPWCYGQDLGFDAGDTMSIALAKDLAIIAKDVGVEEISLLGGEPTLWSGLCEFNQFCRGLGISTTLITNGALFGDDEYWRRYRETPCDEVAISVKAVGEERFEQITQSRLYEQTRKGIQRGIELHSSGVTTVYNGLVGLEGLREIAAVSRELGAKSLTLDLCTPVIENDTISSGFSVELSQMAQDIMKIYPFLDSLYEGSIDIAAYVPLCLFSELFVEMLLEKGQMSTICHVCLRGGLNFTSAGDVIPCNQVFDTILARKGVDYHDGTTLLSHLNSESLVEDYRQLLRYPSNECQQCRWQHNCRGGCMLNWALADPSICHAVPA